MWFVLVWFYDILEFRHWKVNLRCLRLLKDIKNHIVIIKEGNKQGSKAQTLRFEKHQTKGMVVVFCLKLVTFK